MRRSERVQQANDIITHFYFDDAGKLFALYAGDTSGKYYCSTLTNKTPTFRAQLAEAKKAATWVEREALAAHAPAIRKFACPLGLLVKEDLRTVVGLEVKRVQVCEFVLLVVVQLDLVLLLEVLAAFVENEMDLRHVVAAEIRAKHNVILRVPSKLFGVASARQQL